jgi:hypothetical protein
MGSIDREPPEVELGDPPVAKDPCRRRWTTGRVATDLAIVAVAVPIGLDLLVPPPRSGCGMTPQFYALTLGSTFIYVRLMAVAITTVRRGFPILGDLARAIDRRSGKTSKSQSEV